jgi:hypothetical protein
MLLILLKHLQILHPHPLQRTLTRRFQHHLQHLVTLSFVRLRLVRPQRFAGCSKSLVKSVSCMLGFAICRIRIVIFGVLGILVMLTTEED